MPPFSRVLYAAAVIGLSVVVAACADDPPPNTPASPSQVSPSPVTVLSVNLDGPTRLAPGEKAQYIATLSLSSFVTKVAPNVRWIASPPSFLQVDASGFATGGPFSGGAAITADVTLPNGTLIRKSISVTVVPQNTFLLLGTVTDAEDSRPVPGARVEPTSGSLKAETDFAGFYRLFGVPLNPEVRVTAAGYHTLTQTLEVGGDTRHDFRLTRSGPRLIFAGAYTLTIETVGVCGLPQSLQQRHYDAFLTQGGMFLVVVLTEPRFLVVNGAGNRFWGDVHATGATFEIFWPDDWYDPPPSVVERLPDGTFLVVAGTVAATGSADGLSGTLNGAVSHLGAGFPQTNNLLGRCSSPRLTLTPR